MTKLARISTAIASAAIALAPFAAAHATQYSFSSNIESAEPASSRPIPTTITWVASAQVDDGDKILDHMVVVVNDDTDEEIAALTVTDTDSRSITLNKINVPDMKVFSTYTVRVDEYYTDDTSSEGFDGTFYTRPPRLQNIRVINKILEDDGDMTVTVRWRMPVNLRDNYIYYDYKVVRPNNHGRLVASGYEWGNNVHTATISDLPARRSTVKVRARDDNHGTGRWSEWKTFQAPVEE